MRALLAAITLLAITSFVPAQASTVVSHKTGARATGLSAMYATRFQAYIDDLEAHGAKVLFMGGYRSGHCSSGHLHPCGRALDVCQLSRGRVDHRCNLPSRGTIGAIAASHGLFEGGRWCDSDYGHAQIGGTACGEQYYASARRHMRRVARRHHHHHRVRLAHR